MPFQFFDHTGDIGVRLQAGSLEDLFRDAAAALLDTLTVSSQVEPSLTESIALEADAIDLLLVEWLSELLYRFEVRGLLVARSSIRLERSAARPRLRADVEGELFDPARHRIKVLVKAITYHALAVEESAGGWKGTVILDI